MPEVVVRAQIVQLCRFRNTVNKSTGPGSFCCVMSVIVFYILLILRVIALISAIKNVPKQNCFRTNKSWYHLNLSANTLLVCPCRRVVRTRLQDKMSLTAQARKGISFCTVGKAYTTPCSLSRCRCKLLCFVVAI